jgi:transcriptional regulator with XRE-family HTH domain
LTDISLKGKDQVMLAPVETKAPPGVPDVGAVIRRLRMQRGISVRALAASSGLSASFLGAVERGDSDIALGRLALVANALDHDVASLLGYSLRQATPRVVAPARKGSRGDGVEFSAFRIPGSQLELLVASFAPHSGFDDSITHAGIDVAYVTQGELLLIVDSNEYPLTEGQCVVWPSSHPHTMRNVSDEPAIVVGFATEIVH